MVNFTPLFKPGSMAVAGVSLSNERHPANVIYNKIHLRYPVKVYPVNPKGGVFKRDRVYRGMEEIPGPVDLAVIAVRADFVPETLAQCIRKFLLKPVDKEELAVAIRSALDATGTPPYLVPNTPLP